MNEEEIGAWKLYVSLEAEYGSGPIKETWHDLDKESQEYAITLYRQIDSAAKRLADSIDKELFGRLVNQEHWT